MFHQQVQTLEKNVLIPRILLFYNIIALLLVYPADLVNQLHISMQLKSGSSHVY